MTPGAERIPSRKLLIVIGLTIGAIIVLPISFMRGTVPFGMIGSILLGAPIALTLQRGYGYDVPLMKRKRRSRLGSILLMLGGVMLFIIGLSGFVFSSL